MVLDLDNYVFVCPEYGQEFTTLEDYLEYSEGQHDYLISDYLGCSYHFPSVDSYQEWVRTELINNGKTLYEFKIEQQSDKKLETIRVQVGRQQLIRLASSNIRTFSRKARFARELAFT